MTRPSRALLRYCRVEKAEGERCHAILALYKGADGSRAVASDPIIKRLRGQLGRLYHNLTVAQQAATVYPGE